MQALSTRTIRTWPTVVLLAIVTSITGGTRLNAYAPGRAVLLSDALPGELVITEIMQNPVAVSDTVGEWFEIHNVSDRAIELAGLVIVDLGSDSFTLPPDQSIVLPPSVEKASPSAHRRPATT